MSRISLWNYPSETHCNLTWNTKKMMRKNKIVRSCIHLTCIQSSRFLFIFTSDTQNPRSHSDQMVLYGQQMTSSFWMMCRCDQKWNVEKYLKILHIVQNFIFFLIFDENMVFKKIVWLYLYVVSSQFNSSIEILW